MNHENKSCGNDRDNTPQRSSDEIKHDIDRTLSSMDSTVCQLQDKMTVRGIVNELTGGIASSGGASGIARKAGGRVVEAAKANPVPAALMGLGVAWLIADRIGKNHADHYEVGRGRDTDWLAMGAEYTPGARDTWRSGQAGGQGHRVTETISEKLGDVRESAYGMAEHARERASEALGSVRGRVSNLTDTARERASHLQERVSEFGHTAREKLHGYRGTVQAKATQLKGQTEHMYQETPLAFGAAALAVGLVSGLLVPVTRREEELLGDASERFKEKAKALGQTALHQGAEMATAVAGSVKEQVIGEDTRIVDKVKDVARTVIESGKEQVKQKVESIGGKVQSQSQNLGQNFNQGSPGRQYFGDTGSSQQNKQGQSGFQSGGSCPTDMGDDINVD